MHDIGSLRHEDRAATDAAAVVARGDAVTANIGFDAIEHGDEAIRLALDGERLAVADPGAIASAAEIGHRSSSFLRNPRLTYPSYSIVKMRVTMRPPGA